MNGTTYYDRNRDSVLAIYKLGLLVGYLEGIGSERGITDRGTTNCKRDTDACRTGAISSRRK